MNAILAKSMWRARVARKTPRNVPILHIDSSVKIPVIKVRSRKLSVRDSFNPPIRQISRTAPIVTTVRKPTIQRTAKHPRVDSIIATVADYYGQTVMGLKSDRRTKSLILPRHVAMYIAKELTPHSYPLIGRYFNGRDHTTVMHAWRKIEAGLKTDDQLRVDIETINQKLAFGPPEASAPPDPTLPHSTSGGATT